MRAGHGTRFEGHPDRRRTRPRPGETLLRPGALPSPSSRWREPTTRATYEVGGAVARPYPLMALVATWTGVEVRALRGAKRMSVREFAAYVGVSGRVVGKWEAGGADAVP